MSRSNFPSRAQRRGQALLLAVLIMIFAALLSASFLVVVSVNLNQTARQTDKSRAVASAKAGLDYVNNRLTYSAEGDKWFDTELRNTNTTVDYYSPLDMAQGWAGSFLKFPNPRQISQGDGPQFLTKVERIPLTLTPTDPDFDKAGALKITVIGLSSDDPTAYHRTVAYKGGFNRSPLANTARFVSQWDFKRNVVPAAIANVAANTTTLVVTRANSDLTQIASPFLITMSNPAAGVPARSAAVSSAAAVIDTVTMKPVPGAYTLTTVAPVTVAAEERVELAANLGAPSGINYNNAVPPVVTPIAVNLSDTNSDITSTVMPGPNQVDGARINGSAVYSGNLNALRLRPVAGSFNSTGLIPGLFLASGVIAPDNTTTAPVTSINIAGNIGPSDTLQASAANGIFTSTMPMVAGRNQVVSDGWDVLRAVPSASTSGRTVSSIRPPDISSGEGLERYRNATQFSKPYDDGNPLTPALPATASLYGYGQGIYINNVADREKVGIAADKTREMTQAELVQMWMSPATATASFSRLGTPEAPTLNTKSLEEQHLRGWVSADEFRSRGAEIELTRDYDPNMPGDQPGLFITLDPRIDNNNTTLKPRGAFGPDVDKAWKDSSGAAQTGIYRKGFPWPTNGVILAEGNVRLRSQGLGAPRSLTIVSMNNIYIEDSFSIDADYDGDLTTGKPRKPLLMARRNIVMNPTRVISRPDGQTVSTNGADVAVTVGGTTTVDVADSSEFRVGDVIETTKASATADCIAQITGITGNSIGAKVVYAAAAGTIAANSDVRSHSEATPAIVAGTGVGFSKIGTVQDVIQRRFTLPSVTSPAPMAVPSTIRLDIRHQGVTFPSAVFNVKTADPPTGFTKVTSPDTVYLSNKRVLDNSNMFVPAATTNSDLNKLLRADYSSPPPAGTTPFFSTRPTDDTDAKTSQFSLAALKVEMDSALNSTTTPVPIGYKYDVTLNPAYGGVPFYYLASVGNRLDFAYPPTSAERRKDLLNMQYLTAGYDVPLATSIGIFSDGVSSGISDDTSIVAKTTQFGFSPLFTDVSSMPAKPGEDILTNDQSFYQPTASVRNVTVDSRVLPNWTVGFNSLVMRQSEGLTNVVDATNPLPDYRVMGMKIEDVDLATNALKTGYTFKVNAYVYAQLGSWFVIPGPDYETRVRGDETKSYYDFNDNGTAEVGEWIDGTGGMPGVFDTGDGADLNRNGIIDPGEVVAAIRFSTRYNYQIDFTGAIGENQTALVNDAGVVPGPVSTWMNKWATTSYVAGTPNVLSRSRIHYIFDPTVASGVLDDDPTTIGVIDPDEGFKLPQTTDLFYQD